jgi:nucleoside-diphosphate-sugar epimerase
VRVLFIGGTGNISLSVSRLCVKWGIDLTLLTRHVRDIRVDGARMIEGDINRAPDLPSVVTSEKWDAVVNWVAFSRVDVERDITLFRGRTRQYIFVSSAAVYQKPPVYPVITESTPLQNPYWEYARNKIACEELLMYEYRTVGFPVTIVRPSFTYDTVIPLSIGGWNDYTVIDRIKRGKKVIIHGDGTSIWTATHAEDFAKGFVGLLGRMEAIGQAYHITSDELLTWNQMYQAVADAMGCELQCVHIASETIAAQEPSLAGTLLGDKAHSMIFDNTKIKRLVPDFSPNIPFVEGIRRTMAWLETEPARRVVRPETEKMFERLLSLENGGILRR